MPVAGAMRSFILLVTLFTSAQSVSPETEGPVYPGAAAYSLGKDGISWVFSDWEKIPFKNGPYFETPMNRITRGKFASLLKTVKGTFKIKEMEFYNMNFMEWPDRIGPESDWSTKYKQVQPDRSEVDAAERHWGFFGISTSAFLANVTFGRVKGNKELTCGALGLAKALRGKKDYPNFIFIKYDATIIKHPFKYVGINEWVEDETRNHAEHWIFIDPFCCDFDGGEEEVAKFTTAIDDVLMNERLRRYLIDHLMKFYEKWVIEPNRYHLTGFKRLPGSEYI